MSISFLEGRWSIGTFRNWPVVSDIRRGESSLCISLSRKLITQFFALPIPQLA